MNGNRLLPVLGAVFAVIFWGASFIATKVSLREISPITVVWLRFTIGVLILGAAVLLRRQYVPIQRKELGYFALLGFLGITFHQWLQSTGLTTSQASTTAWIVATTPVFMALLGWLALREKLDRIQVAGIGLATIGVLLVVSEGDLASLSLGQFGAPGDILILISSVNWAVFSTLSRRGLGKFPATLMMFYVMLFGWLFTSVAFFTGKGITELPQLTINGWLGVGFLGVFCSGLAYIFWYDALKALPASQVGAFLYLEPFVAVVVAGIILGEPVLVASMTGGGAILFGVWLVNRRTG